MFSFVQGDRWDRALIYSGICPNLNVARSMVRCERRAAAFARAVGRSLRRFLSSCAPGTNLDFSAECTGVAF